MSQMIVEVNCTIRHVLTINNMKTAVNQSVETSSISNIRQIMRDPRLNVIHNFIKILILSLIYIGIFHILISIWFTVSVGTGNTNKPTDS